MAVANHLKIDLHDYDARIRTFIPDYESMLDAAVGALAAAQRPTVDVLDLGTGTGALAARVARARPEATILGIDEDPGMLHMAARRLGRRATLEVADFVRAPFPRCDAITASFSLHHVEHRRTKARLFARARTALRRGGVLVSADCHPPANRALADAGREAWHAHLARHYGRRRATAFLEAWAEGDFYVPLEVELTMLRKAGFRTDVFWRRNAFAVIVAQA